MKINENENRSSRKGFKNLVSGRVIPFLYKWRVSPVIVPPA